MSRRTPRQRSLARLFISHATITLVPVVILGLVLAASYRSEARQRGVAFGKSEALAVAQTAIEPILDGRPLTAGLSAEQTRDLRQLVAHAIGNHDILRLRLRDLNGQVVFSDDGSGFKQQPEDEALDAAHGDIVGRLTRMNSDSNDSGKIGPEAVEVYLPLMAGATPDRVGVVEVYMPYAPIQSEVSAGLRALYQDLLIGLAALWVALFAISLSASRGLRRQVRVNKHQAEHDALTGLANRTLFHQEGSAVLARSAKSGRPAVVALVDLDRFKDVNDSLGHHNGDELLKSLATRLAEGIGDAGRVARLGGDEFGVILTKNSDAEQELRRLRALLEQEVVVNGLPLSVEASIGYVIAPADGRDMDSLLQRADVAMYLAKADHSGVVRYDPTRDHYDSAKLSLLPELRRAIRDNQLVMHYQPKATLPGAEIRTVEALVRWEHPEHGLLYPDSFIPLAEQTDLIDELTAQVLKLALREIAALDQGPSDLSVAVNVSARNLIRPNFAALVKSILAENGIEPRRLTLEITETALMIDPTRAASVLSELAEIGITVSIDDFGIGQTSLSYLSSLPVAELKIDKSFVFDMLSRPTHATIARSIIELGHNLSMRVVAEGVESAEVLDALCSAGCDLVQGYHIARPMPAEHLATWLRRDAGLVDAGSNR